MFNTLMRLYKTGKINETGLNAAVVKGWISETQKVEIITSQ